MREVDCYKIGVIIASVRHERNADAIVEWLRRELDLHPGNLGFSVIDLQTWHPPHYAAPTVPAQRAYDEWSKKWSAEIDTYDGFLMLVPEYNHGYSGVLKDAIDHLFHEWCFKPVAFVGYGTDGGTRAIEQLRQVVIQLNMAPIRREVMIPVWDSVKAGQFIAGDRYAAALHELLRQLEWWTIILAEGRATRKPTL